jgi:voltage-gated potassium channel
MPESKLKKFLHATFEDHSNTCGHFIQWFIAGLIFISIILFTLLQIPEYAEYHNLIILIDRIVLLLFALEYFSRLIASRDKLRFGTRFLNVVDLIVILPAFTVMLGPITYLRAFRLLEIFRILKLVRYSELMHSFFRSFCFYKQEMKIFGLTAGIGLVISAFSMFLLEQHVNPQINDLGDAFWWATATMSTVGYGDIIPITIGGKILSALSIVIGLGAIAIMTAILTKIFMDHFFGKRLHACLFCRFPRHDFDAKYCKNCGNALNEGLQNNPR